MAIRLGRVGLQLCVEQQGPEEKIASQAFVQQHGVFAEPAKSGPAGEVTFQERSRVDHRPAAAGWQQILNPLQ